MKNIKNDQEIELMTIAGKICSEALNEVLKYVDSGVSCSQLDKVAHDFLEKRGATSSFMTIDDYKWTICTTINEQVVHGIPTDRALANGDILGIDIGACYLGFHSDMARTVPIGEVSKSTKHFLEVGKITLVEAVDQARVGNTIGDISATIQKGVEGAGYSVVRSLTGHGIGRELHEKPFIPGFGKRGIGPAICENMVLAIEVIYTQGSPDVRLEKDGWTIATVDESLGGLFEQTVAVTRDGPIVLTPYI